ncbi:MAG TPA: hypothetical protein VNF51_00710 [Candidatus Paceibacterota bacterium]|nr:hypothetical protein [Candidatus Paceibacterota bacterium]
MRVGRMVIVCLANTTDAKALKDAFNTAHLAQKDSAKLVHRYAEEHGIVPGTPTATD